MTATFGKLEHATLTLEPGLNIIHAPNEWGKSTWCAFLVTMLYGMETRLHTTKAALADKERYAPWSGSPMSGSIELCWKGRDITIQRRTKGRVPMGEFQAFETKTGVTVPELTAANCGQMLLGVEKPVFLRSGFLRGSELVVEQEDSLRRRLNALVTTGDDSGTAEALAGKLKELKNRCRANRTTGLLPQALAQKAQLEQTLDTLQSLGRQCRSLERELQQQQWHRRQLQGHLQTLDYRESLENRTRLEAALDRQTQARLQEELYLRQCAHLPSEEVLQEKLTQLSGLRRELDALHTRLRQLISPPEPEKMPREDAVAQAAQDAVRWRVLGVWQGLLLALCVTALIAGGVLLWQQMLLYGGLLLGLGALCLLGGVFLGCRRSRLRKQHDRLPPEQWEETAARTVASWQAMQTYINSRAALEQQLQALEQRIAALTGGENAAQYEQRLRREQDVWQALRAAQQEYLGATQLVEALKLTCKTVEPPAQEDLLTHSRQETQALLADCTRQLQQLQLRLGSCQGQMAALGREEELHCQLEALTRRIGQLEDTCEALELAQNTLCAATAHLQRRFAPQIVRQAQELVGEMTDGRYQTLTLQEDLRLQVRTQEEDTLRSSLWRSEGTVDQLYLALRLAVARELTPDVPLVLDDALVRFDDTRLHRAVELLYREAQHRQIILFTCQKREQEALADISCIGREFEV